MLLDLNPKNHQFLHPAAPAWGDAGDFHTKFVTNSVTERLGGTRHGVEQGLENHAAHIRHHRDVHEHTNLGLLNLTAEEEELYASRAGQPEYVADNIIFLRQKAQAAFQTLSVADSPEHEHHVLSRVVRKITLEMLGCVQESWNDTKVLDDAIWHLPNDLAARDSSTEIKTHEYDTDFAVNEHTKYTVWPIFNGGPSRTTPKNLALAGVRRRRATLDYGNIHVFKESQGLIVMNELPPALRSGLAEVLLARSFEDDDSSEAAENARAESKWAVETAGILFFNASRMKDDAHTFVVPTGAKILASAIRP